MEESVRRRESYKAFLKWAKRAAIPALILARIMLVAGVFSLLVGSFSGWYLWGQGWKVWSWILAILLCGIPTVGAVFFWYAFTLVKELPEVIDSLKDRLITQLPKYKGYVKEKEQRVGLVKKAKIGVQLAADVYMVSDDVEGAVTGASVLAFAASPLAWVVALIVLGACVLGPFIMGAVLLVQWITI